MTNDNRAVSVVVVFWLSEWGINHTFPGSSPASPDIGVWLLKEICSFPMITIKLRTIIPHLEKIDN